MIAERHAWILALSLPLLLMSCRSHTSNPGSASAEFPGRKPERKEEKCQNQLQTREGISLKSPRGAVRRAPEDWMNNVVQVFAAVPQIGALIGEPSTSAVRPRQ